MLSIKRWTNVFRTLANANRLKIIKMLSEEKKFSVSEISEKLGISFKATSNNLIILKNLDVLDSLGTEGHVLYSVNPEMPSDFRIIIKMILNKHS